MVLEKVLHILKTLDANKDILKWAVATWVHQTSLPEESNGLQQLMITMHILTLKALFKDCKTRQVQPTYASSNFGIQHV